MKKIVVLDHINDTVWVHDYDENVFDDGEDCINSLIEEGKVDTVVSCCQYMVIDNLSIDIL